MIKRTDLRIDTSGDSLHPATRIVQIIHLPTGTTVRANSETAALAKLAALLDGPKVSDL